MAGNKVCKEIKDSLPHIFLKRKETITIKKPRVISLANIFFENYVFNLKLQLD